LSNLWWDEAIEAGVRMRNIGGDPTLIKGAVMIASMSIILGHGSITLAT
jgi:hypothetical protein